MATPAGSIIAYAGINDPDGYVICDGVQRTNGSDGRYNNLVSMGIGTGTANGNYTPPNLKGAFLRGTGTGTDANSAGNATILTAQSSAVQQHQHSVSDPGHTHDLNFRNRWNSSDLPGALFAASSNGGGEKFSLDVNNSFIGDAVRLDSAAGAKSKTTGLTVTNVSGATANATETRPFNYSINWIMKL